MNTRVLSKVRIGIIDIFGKKKGIPINCIKDDFTHGELVSSVLTKLTGDLDVSITKIPVRVRNGSKNKSFDLKSLLKQLKKINKNGKDYDYINISTSSEMPYGILNLSEDGAELANPEVRAEILNKLRAGVLPLKNGMGPQQIIHIIDEMERINKSGTEIFISACNKSKSFNLFSLAEGVHTIGGRDGITHLPIKRFSSNPLVENYQNLPVYITKQKSITNETSKTAVNLKELISIESDLAKLSRKELSKKIATKDDYIRLKSYIDALYNEGKYKFDIDFLRFKFVSSVDKNLRGKIFDLNKFMNLFDGKFDEEVLKYTFPQGTHCDLSFRQFFDMTSKSKHVISMKKTTKITNTVSGTSFAVPQGLNQALRENFKKQSISYVC